MSAAGRLALVAFVAAACGDGGGGGGGGTLTHSFGPVRVPVGGEIADACIAWGLHNEEPLYLETVAMSAGPGWHHSNWFAIEAGTGGYTGDDEDLEACTAHRLDSIGLGVAGTLMFGQSTQTQAEVQRLPAGAVLELPPHAVIVGDLHLYNATEAVLETSLELTLETVPLAPEHTRMRVLGLQYGDLQILPHARSSFTTECAVGASHQEQLDRPLDYSIFYALPHYHGLAEGLRVELVGGPQDGEVLFESSAADGEALGRTFDPPRDLTGTEALRVTCTYDNPTDATVGWGNGDAEMCAFGAFIDGDLNWLGGLGTTGGNQALGDTDGDGVLENRGPCTLLPVAPRL